MFDEGTMASRWKGWGRSLVDWGEMWLRCVLRYSSVGAPPRSSAWALVGEREMTRPVSGPALDGRWPGETRMGRMRGIGRMWWTGGAGLDCMDLVDRGDGVIERGVGGSERRVGRRIELRTRKEEG